jgi:hypothetical protein
MLRLKSDGIGHPPMALISADRGGGQSSDKLARDFQFFQKARFRAAIAFIDCWPDKMHQTWSDAVFNA